MKRWRHRDEGRYWERKENEEDDKGRYLSTSVRHRSFRRCRIWKRRISCLRWLDYLIASGNRKTSSPRSLGSSVIVSTGTSLGRTAPSSAVASTASTHRHFLQLRRNLLLCFRQNFDQVASFGSVSTGEESVSSSSLVSAASTTDTMNVVFRIVGVVVIDNELDVVYV